MGTTVVATTMAGREAVIAHVGDSRAYLARAGSCVQLTADHSRVAEMVRMKLLSPEQAAGHPARSQLTRSLGGEPAVKVELSRTEFDAGRRHRVVHRWPVGRCRPSRDRGARGDARIATPRRPRPRRPTASSS